MRFLYTFMEIYKENTFFLYMHTVMQKKHVFLSTYLCIFAPCSLSREHLVFITFSQDSEKKRQFFLSKATTKRTGCVVSLQLNKRVRLGL